MAHFLFDFSFSACTKALLREMEGMNFWPTMFGSKFVESDVLHRCCSLSIRQVLGVWAVLWSRPIGRCSISPLSVFFSFAFHIDPCFVHSPNFIGCTVWGTGWGAFDKKEFHQIVVSLTCVLWSLKMTHQEVFSLIQIFSVSFVVSVLFEGQLSFTSIRLMVGEGVTFRFFKQHH